MRMQKMLKKSVWTKNFLILSDDEVKGPCVRFHEKALPPKSPETQMKDAFQFSSTCMNLKYFSQLSMEIAKFNLKKMSDCNLQTGSLLNIFEKIQIISC